MAPQTGDHQRSLPYAFTKQGVAMLSSVLNRNRVVHGKTDRFPPDFMFQPILQEVTNLKSQFVTSSWGTRRVMPKKYDHQFKIVFDAIKQLLTPPVKPRRKIGFEGKA